MQDKHIPYCHMPYAELSYTLSQIVHIILCVLNGLILLLQESGPLPGRLSGHHQKVWTPDLERLLRLTLHLESGETCYGQTTHHPSWTRFQSHRTLGRHQPLNVWWTEIRFCFSETNRWGWSCWQRNTTNISRWYKYEKQINIITLWIISLTWVISLTWNVSVLTGYASRSKNCMSNNEKKFTHYDTLCIQPRVHSWKQTHFGKFGMWRNVTGHMYCAS